MSASYTLHVAPYASPGDAEALDRASLVRDGFSWWAFLLPPVWFFAHRHWIVALALTILLAGFWALLRQSGLPGGAIFLLNALLWLLVGLESSTLRRWDYARQGRPVVDVVFATSEAEAEAKAFARWLGAETAAPTMPVPQAVPVRRAPAPWGPEEPHVLGLFPDLERRR